MQKTVVIDGNLSLEIVGKGTIGVVTVVHDGEAYPHYDGETVVIPMAFEEQILRTKDMVVMDDITVKEIPYTEVGNPFGGTTVSIG